MPPRCRMRAAKLRFPRIFHYHPRDPARPKLFVFNSIQIAPPPFHNFPQAIRTILKMDLTFGVFRATIPCVRYVAIAAVVSISSHRSTSLPLLRALCVLCVKIPMQPLQPTSPAHHSTQPLPSFSTPSKHRAHTNTRKLFPLYRLLYSSLYARFFASPLLPHRPFPIPRAHKPFRCNAYKKPGGGGPHACPSALLTIHYPLLTPPLIPLHYF
jgi:hypothetical protein